MNAASLVPGVQRGERATGAASHLKGRAARFGRDHPAKHRADDLLTTEKLPVADFGVGVKLKSWGAARRGYLAVVPADCTLSSVTRTGPMMVDISMPSGRRRSSRLNQMWPIVRRGSSVR